MLAGMRMSMNIKSTQWPGKTVETLDKQVSVGPNIKVPIGEAFEDLPTTFYSSKDLSEWKFISHWMEMIDKVDDWAALKSYNDIVGTGSLSVLNEYGGTTASIELISIYPVLLGPIELAYENTNEVATFTVDWTYHHFAVQ